MSSTTSPVTSPWLPPQPSQCRERLPAFKDETNAPILFEIAHDNGNQRKIEISNRSDGHYPRWFGRIHHLIKTKDGFKGATPSLEPTQTTQWFTYDEFSTEISNLFHEFSEASEKREQQKLKLIDKAITNLLARSKLTFATSPTFLIYSPENTALRIFAAEGQVLPLGIKGEGLFKLLRFISTDVERWDELKSHLKMIDWFRDIAIAPEQAPFEQTLQIHDRFLAKTLDHFDQRSANEGFLFLLFYLSLMISPDTPSIFAIDNVDASLNPKTANALTSRLAQLAKKYNKQIFLTTHSPAVLDGLDLNDPEHRLFVFQRNRKGETRARRVTAPQPVAGEVPVKLSEAFLRGLIGGLPQNF